MYYIVYRPAGSGRGTPPIEEPLGRTSDGWNPNKASLARADRIAGKEQSNKERRAMREKASLFGRGKLTLRVLWQAYDKAKPERTTRKTELTTFLPKLDRLLDREAASLTTADINALRSRLEKTKSRAARKTQGEYLSAQTVKGTLELVRRLLNFGKKMGVLAWPANLVFEFPRVDNEKTEMMNGEQLARYLRAIDEEPDRAAQAYMLLLLNTGIRKTAALSLQWSDVDFERGLLTLRGEHAKNDRTAYIPLSPMAANMLNTLPRVSDWIFPSPLDPAERRKDFKRQAQRAKEKAGLPKDFRPSHGLRHVFASLLAQSGKATLYDISKLLTHSDTKVTQRYAHLMPEHLRNAAAGVTEAMLLAIERKQ